MDIMNLVLIDQIESILFVVADVPDLAGFQITRHLCLIKVVQFCLDHVPSYTASLQERIYSDHIAKPIRSPNNVGSFSTFGISDFDEPSKCLYVDVKEQIEQTSSHGIHS